MDPQKITSQNEEVPSGKQAVEEVEQMNQQLAVELVELLKDPKIQVKYGSLNAILQYTKSQSAKLLFLNTQFFKLVVESLKCPQIHKLCLSTLIHFSSQQQCAVKLIEYIEPIVLEIKSATGLPEELGLLFLLNISKQSEFTEKIISRKQKQSKQVKQIEQKEAQNQGPLSSALLQIIFSFIQSKPQRRWVIANILVNVSSNVLGREYVAKQKLYLEFLKYINDDKQSLRLAVLRIIRNVSFLWQNEEVVTQILKKENNLINHISIHMLIMIIKSKLIEDFEKATNILKQSNYNKVLDYDMEIQPDLPRILTTKQKSINQIEICVDIIILLSNSDFPNRKPEFFKDQLKQVISLLNFTNISEESKDKLEALETFCFW